MESSRNFTARNPVIIHQLCMMLVGAMIAIMAFFTLIDGPEPAMYITFSILFVIPFSVAALWSRRKYIRVNGTTITVQNGLALFPFEISVYDITRVKCIVTQMRTRRNINMTVYAGRKKFGVETTMDNSGKLIAYIRQYVAPDKIHTIEK